MLSALKKLLFPLPPQPVRETYIALVAQARNPFFFGPLGVPDTLDGRFELIVLHLFLLQHRLLPAHPKFAQQLSESFLNDMDRSLREIGVSDTGVSHRIKKMGKAYNGRLQAYGAGLSDAETLHAALARNLYGTLAEGDVKLLEKMASYMHQQVARLAGAEDETVLQGTYAWAPAEALAA